MTIAVEARLQRKRAESLSRYTNCYDWIYYLKNGDDFRRFSAVFDEILRNHYLSDSEKCKCFIFLYERFVKRYEEVSALMAKKKGKSMKFKPKSFWMMIWGC